jgi:hypothetical protein
MEKLKVNRIEIINHAKNRLPIGRVLSLHQRLGDFDSISIDYQDGELTLKIFIENSIDEKD